MSAGGDLETTAPPLATVGAIQAGCSVPNAVTEQVFDYGLCLCGDLELVGSGVSSSSYSWLLGEDEGLGHVGINGEVNTVGSFDVDGILNVSHGLSGVGSVDVSRDLLSGRDIAVTGSWDVGEDASIDGDLNGVGSLSVGNDLNLSGDLQVVGSVDYDQLQRGFNYAGLPCPCGDASRLDVDAIIAAHADDNDNDRLPARFGGETLVLEDGDYYFADSVALVGAARVVIDGFVSIYLDGSLQSVGSLDIEVSDRGQLSLWVADGIDTVGSVEFSAGEPRPRAFRLYMGGDGVSTVGSSRFVGGVYAPNTDFQFVGSLEVEGALFARNIEGTGSLEITYDSDLTAPDECVEPLL